MAFDYYYDDSHDDEEKADAAFNEHIEEVEAKAARYVRSDLIRDFLKMLSCAHECEMPEAEKLVRTWSLDKLHFLAIDGKKEQFRTEWLLSEHEKWVLSVYENKHEED